MARISTTQDVVLERVAARLRATIEKLNATTCVISDETQPSEMFSHNLIVLVSPMGGTFDGGVVDGAGLEGCLESSGVIVTVWTAMNLDAPERAESRYLEANRGLMAWKKSILQALCNHDLTDTSGNQILVSRMRPVRSQHQLETTTAKGRLAGFSLLFTTEFLWNLSD